MGALTKQERETLWKRYFSLLVKAMINTPD